MQNIISIENISKHRYGEFSLRLEHVEVKAGELVALVGASGCGKSTALDLMAGVLCPDFALKSEQKTTQHFTLTPEKSTIDMLELWRNKKQNKLALIRRDYIGYVLQTGGLLPFLTGMDNIMLACHGTTDKDYLQSLAKILDIAHLLKKKPAQMSVGERQRFAIARALINKPRLILADEPVASLDPLNASTVLELFVKLAKEQGISIIMVSHAPDMAKAMGFRLIPAQIKREEKEIISSFCDTNNRGQSHVV